MPWQDEDANVSRGDGESGKVGQRMLSWEGMLLTDITAPTSLASADGTADVARLSRSDNAYVLAITGTVPSSGSIVLDWLSQTVTCNWDQDAASLQAAILALNNVDIAEVVGGPWPNIPLLLRLWPTVGNRTGAPASMTIGSQSLGAGLALLRQGLGYSGTTNTLTISDPSNSGDAGAYCTYEKIGRIYVPKWIGC